MPKMKAHAPEARMAGQDLTPMCSEPMGLSRPGSGSWWGWLWQVAQELDEIPPVMKRQRQKWGKNACPLQVLESSGNSLS